MAKIINRANNDKTLVLGTREGLVYPLPFSDWNSIKIGVYISACSATSGDDQNYDGVSQAQLISVQGAKDRYYFGLKNNNDKFPGENGEPFVGYFAGGANYSRLLHAFNTFNGTTFGDSNGLGTIATERPTVTGVIQGNGVFSGSCGYTRGTAGALGAGIGYNVSGSTSYSKIWRMGLTMINKGTSNQKIRINLELADGLTEVSNTDDDHLKNDLNIDYGTSAVFDYNLSGVPYAVPLAIFLYSPFTTLKVRVHNIGVLKIN